MHCCPTAHLVVRITDPKGYVFAETGRRCSTGLVEIFAWDGRYNTMPTEEFEVWQEMWAKPKTLADVDEIVRQGNIELFGDASPVR